MAIWNRLEPHIKNYKINANGKKTSTRVVYSLIKRHDRGTKVNQGRAHPHYPINQTNLALLIACEKVCR